jgi:hypothetical protein
MDVWSKQELERLIDRLSERGLISEETATSARQSLRGEGLQAAIELLQATGVLSRSER